ncbi:MAG: bifunctional oligoribonuclease/PAP phosphatase NrnA [Candidatus Gastranaerophilaceae bacterium]
MKFNQLEDSIKNSKKILIVSHINPDGDALGSTSAMYNAIYDNFKKKADMLVVGHFPNLYRFLPNIENAILKFDDSMVYDLVITLDVAALDRLSAAQILFDKAKYTINIDHHKTNNEFGNINIVSAQSSSTGELLLSIFNELEWKISLETAIGLYTAILTDTGGFKYENTSENVFHAAAQLVKIGINPNKIYKNCYESKSKNFVMFQNYCINKAVFENNDSIAYTTVYKRDFERFNGEEDFTEGLVESLRAIETTDIAFIAKEIDSKTTKISMRSKQADVAKICSAFGGGGHTFAAGCTIKTGVDSAVKRVLNIIKETING